MDLPIAEAQLPRGPHRLTRSEVAESQRGRLYLAMLDAVAESGYHAITIADLVARAKVSRRTFYELFSSKEECFAAAFDRMVELVSVELADAVRSPRPLGWRELVHRSLTAYLDILAGEPAIARALHVEAFIAGPALAGYRHRLMTIFADRMRAARAVGVQQGDLTGELSDDIYRFLIGGIDDRIREHLQFYAVRTLPALEPTLTSIALTLLRHVRPDHVHTVRPDQSQTAG